MSFSSSHALVLKEKENTVKSCFVLVPGNSQYTLRLADTICSVKAQESMKTYQDLILQDNFFSNILSFLNSRIMSFEMKTFLWGITETYTNSSSDIKHLLIGLLSPAILHLQSTLENMAYHFCV